MARRQGSPRSEECSSLNGVEVDNSSQAGTQPSHISSIEKNIIQAQVIEMLRTCYDPEIPVNIYELGLVYEVNVDDAANVTVVMTLTSPHCPAVQSLPREIEAKTRTVQGVAGVKIDLVWAPPWNPSMMSEAAKLELGMQ